jgi:hypothetical protein
VEDSYKLASQEKICTFSYDYELQGGTQKYNNAPILKPLITIWLFSARWWASILLVE